ncbi:RNA-binding protein [Methylocystis heyeri]|uniref:RNA-binding protein n=1 Tax=Methylocystis heyeri TaxID=391905 RepID=A0A6B8KKM8_9HYPH|nr:RNA-binding protein [Methylocystis heyeri]QGM47218.1 RNA-binding protein [Methylocystis heyeri]
MTKQASHQERTCIITRRQDAPEGMIRFVRAPDGTVAPDIRSRLPGRGVWVTANAGLVAEAARKQAFSRSLKTRAEASPALAEEVDRLLEADCLQMLAMANKAGAAAFGFGKVAAALEGGEIAVLLEAVDGGEDGRRKLAQSARRGEASTGICPKTVSIFTSNQLDLAFGRTNVIHAGLAAGGLTDAFFSRVARLVRYRAAPGRMVDEELGSRRRLCEDDRATENLMRMGQQDPGSETE